ncbi:S1C family serine protease [Candidatus Pelagibacter communis]|uniref:S1C family serine protease n=1 Tax=Pelagibacter ubique TaxID=198252 RepID=UPI00094C69A2|nr:serine protease [Candidatus Pelagibacter ubique]
MKKIIGIVILSLLFSNVLQAKNAELENLVPVGSSKKYFCSKAQGAVDKILKPDAWGDLWCHGIRQKHYIYFSNFKTEIITIGNNKGVHFVYENVTKRMTCKNVFCKKGNGTLRRIAYSKQDALIIANNDKYAEFLKKEEIKIAEDKKKKDEKKEIAEKPKKKELKTNPDDNKIVPAGSGSGFFVSKDGHAITNYHVIQGCDINKLSFKGSATEVKVLAVDKVNDIAILKSNIKPDEIFPVSNDDVSLLEDVIVAGFPLGKQISSAIKTHKGVVTALAGAGDNYSFFQTDAAINQGNSGGPIINQKGNVVGIAVATWVEEGVQGVHFGIKSSTLKTFASANDLSFASPNFRDLSNKDLGKLITKGTVYVECHMTVAKIKKMIAQAENRKAFFKEHK